MAYFASDSSKSENGFEYPDPEATFHVPSEHQTQMSGYPASSRQNCYPSPSHQAMYQAMTSIADHPHQSSTSNPWQEEPSFGQVTPVPLLTTRPLAPLESGLQHTEKDNGRFVPYPAARQQPRRGTTGKIVCADCGGRFTVISSLNRHSKICRGRKKAWQPASTQHSVSDLSVHPLAANERGSNSSEGRSSVTGFNSNIYHTPTKRTRSASHDIEDSILTNKLRNDASPTAYSNWSPPAQHAQTEGLHSSNFHTVSATNTSFSPSNAQTPSLMSGPYAQSPYSHNAIGTRSYVPQSRDTSADHNTFFCDVCYGTFPRRDLLQLHMASAHGVTEEP